MLPKWKAPADLGGEPAMRTRGDTTTRICINYVPSFSFRGRATRERLQFIGATIQPLLISINHPPVAYVAAVFDHRPVT